MSRAMTHLARVADRIDRPYSPWGGREGRELENLFNDHATEGRAESYGWKNAIGSHLLQPPRALSV